MVLEKRELLNIQGGAITGTIITAILKGVSVIFDLGRSLGSAFRRIKAKNVCPISN